MTEKGCQLHGGGEFLLWFCNPPTTSCKKMIPAAMLEHATVQHVVD